MGINTIRLKYKQNFAYNGYQDQKNIPTLVHKNSQDSRGNKYIKYIRKNVYHMSSERKAHKHPKIPSAKMTLSTV